MSYQVKIVNTKRKLIYKINLKKMQPISISAKWHIWWLFTLFKRQQGRKAGNGMNGTTKNPKRRQIDFLCLFCWKLVVLTLALWTLHFSYSFSSFFLWSFFSGNWESLDFVLLAFWYLSNRIVSRNFFSRVQIAFTLDCVLIARISQLQRF